MKMASLLPALGAGALMGAMLVFPSEAAAGAWDALSAFARGVLPGLLPFAACALLLTAGRSLPVPLLTLLVLPGGSPAGARLFQDAGLTRRQARRIAACTGGMSPMFFLAALSAWLRSPVTGRLLLCAHLGAGLLAACCFRDRPRGRVSLPPLTLPQAVAQSAQAMLIAAACTAVGGAAARMLACALPGLPPLALAAFQGLLEITAGTRALALHGAPLPLIAALTGFTGLSILMQNAAFWQKSGLRFYDLALIALLRAGLAALLCAVFYRI